MARFIATASSASNPSVDRRLVTYALAGGATATLGSVAGAAIVYSGVQNVTLARPGTPTSANQGIDLNGDTVNDVELAWTYTGPQWRASIKGLSPTGVLGDVGSVEAVDIAAGTTVDGSFSKPAKYTAGQAYQLALYDSTTDAFVSSFSGTTGSGAFVGFQLDAGSGNVNYGWLRIDLPSTAASGASLTVVDWAYESAVNTGIVAGATGAGGVPLPGAAALAALAMGAGGLKDWRRRKSA